MKTGLLYFRDGELIAESGEVRVYKFMNILHLEIGPGHNLWALSSEQEDYIWQLNDRPRGDCLEIGLGLGVASKYILSCPLVKSLTTVEINSNVIEVQRQVNYIDDDRHLVLNTDGLIYMYATNKKFDFVFLDGWDIIDEDTLPMIADYVKAAKRLLKDGREVVGWFDKQTPEEFVKPFFDLFKQEREQIISGKNK